MTTARLTRQPTRRFPLQFTTALPSGSPPPGIAGAPFESYRIAQTRALDLWSTVAMVEPSPGGWEVTQTASVTGGGVLTAQSSAAGATTADHISPDLLHACATRGTIIFEVADAQSSFRVSLTGPPSLTGFKRFHRRGELMITSVHHRSLGRFGWLAFAITLRAGIDQIDVVLDWHNAYPGPDRRFTRAQVVAPAGFVAMPTDPTSAWLGLTRDGVLPQQRHRTARVALVRQGQAPVPEYVATTRTPHLVTGFAVPELAAVPSGFPVVAAKAIIPQPSQMWIPGGLDASEGTSYGGMTGGGEMWPLYGVRWAASGDADALAFLQIEQARNICREAIDLEEDGEPLNLEAHLNARGEADWRKFDRWETPMADRIWPAPGPVLSDDPRHWDPYDKQHDVRDGNENWALATLANDWLAREQIRRHAADERATFWEGPGRANRLAPPVVSGMGTGFGRAESWGMMHVAHARAFGETTYEGMIEVFIEHLTRAEMPSGLFQYGTDYKEADAAPFSGHYGVGSGLEECYLALALHCTGSAVAAGLLIVQAKGFADLSWKQGSTGVWSHSARGIGSQRFTTRNDWPATLAAEINAGHVAEAPDAYHLGYAIACFKRAGSPLADTLLMQFTGKTSVPLALAEVKRWTTLHDMQAPNSQTGAPVDQYAWLLTMEAS